MKPLTYQQAIHETDWNTSPDVEHYVGDQDTKGNWFEGVVFIDRESGERMLWVGVFDETWGLQFEEDLVSLKDTPNGIEMYFG